MTFLIIRGVSPFLTTILASNCKMELSSWPTCDTDRCAPYLTLCCSNPTRGFV